VTSIVREAQNCDVRHYNVNDVSATCYFSSFGHRLCKLWIPVRNHFRWKFM